MTPAPTQTLPFPGLTGESPKARDARLRPRAWRQRPGTFFVGQFNNETLNNTGEWKQTRIILNAEGQPAIMGKIQFRGGKMEPRLALLGVVGLMITLFPCWGSAQETGKSKALRITSPAFENNGTIPPKYGCDGSNVNPPVQIANLPPGTKSLALVFDDQDAPRGSYVHWILWNIDPAEKEIQENSLPRGAVQGRNDFKKNSYGGPCPPTRPHKYALKVYALDTLLELNPQSGKADLEKAMEGRILARGQLVGVYQREKKKK